MKRVAILTNFQGYSEAYSLTRVVSNQIRMLVDNGYEPVVIVGDNFKPVFDFADPKVIIKKIPDVPVSNEVQMDSTFDQDVTLLEKVLAEALDGVDIVLTHDIIYQPACIKHLVAAKRIAARRPDLRWLHWIHSATSPYTLTNLRPLFVDEYAKIISEKFPNSFYVFFNHYSIPRIAENFKVDDQDVKIVHHPTDLKSFYKIEDDSWDLIVKKDILSADVICTYSIRLDRGKQVEAVIKVIGALKHLGNTVKLIIGDFHSTGGDKPEYRKECQKIAEDWGIKDDIIWLSEQKADWEVEVPYKNIVDFEKLQNVFVMPSRSESYSLITQEAGLSGVAMVVNRDWPPFRDIFGWAPHQYPFSSNMNALTGLDGETNLEVSDEKEFYLGVARLLQYEIKNDRSIVLKTKLRKERNLDTIFRTELEPLFFYEPKEDTK